MASTLTPVQEIVLSALTSVAEQPVDDIDRDADLFDLGLDSLDFWTILMDVEDRVGADVPAEFLDRLAQLTAE